MSSGAGPRRLTLVLLTLAIGFVIGRIRIGSFSLGNVDLAP
jgi:hypothetical protein